MSSGIETLAQVEALEKEVSRKIAQGQTRQAFDLAMSKDIASKEDQVKTAFATVVANALTSVKDAEVAALLEELDEEQRGKVMKYVYKGMATTDNGTKLLSWHSKLIEKDGIGIICRAMVDRKI